METRPDPLPDTVMIGVCPRRDHVRAFGGRRVCPASSSRPAWRSSQPSPTVNVLQGCSSSGRASPAARACAAEEPDCPPPKKHRPLVIRTSTPPPGGGKHFLEAD